MGLPGCTGLVMSPILLGGEGGARPTLRASLWASELRLFPLPPHSPYASFPSSPPPNQPTFRDRPLLLVLWAGHLCGSPWSQAHTPPLGLKALHHLASVYLPGLLLCITCAPWALVKVNWLISSWDAPLCFPALVLVLTPAPRGPVFVISMYRHVPPAWVWFFSFWS